MAYFEPKHCVTLTFNLLTSVMHQELLVITVAYINFLRLPVVEIRIGGIEIR